MMLPEELERRALESRTSIFIREASRDWSFSEFYEESGRFASYLHSEFGVDIGDRVILSFPNEISYLISYFACWHLGATVVPVDFEIQEPTLRQIAEDCRPKLILYSQMRSNFPQTSFTCAVFPALASFASIASVQPSGIDQNAIALIMYTSGTTGRPKGVLLSHQNISFTALQIVNWAQLKAPSCEATLLRLTHSFGLGHIHCAVLMGSSIYLMDSVRNPQRFFEAVQNYKISGIPATPALIKLFLTYYREAFINACKELSYIIINTSPMDPKLTNELLEALPGPRIYMYYGLTEASRSTYIEYRKHPTKLDSVGQPVSGIQIRVEAHTSEVQISGPNVMKGYLNEAESFMQDGWFATGDIGHMDDQGFLYITGRIKEQINMDGLKINPLEVETVIKKHGQVKNCIVFGVSDPLTHEKVAAVILCENPTTDPRLLYAEIKTLCKKELEMYKIPREIRIWNEIPITDSGKAKRNEARIKWENGELM